jgi:hypothetical protein
MRSRTEKALWFFLALAAAAAAVLAWWTADQWLPQAQPWAGQALRRLTRPGPDTLPAGAPGKAAPAAGTAASPPPAPPRKCVDAQGRTTYTDQPCSGGTREHGVDGAVTVLPQ